MRSASRAFRYLLQRRFQHFHARPAPVGVFAEMTPPGPRARNALKQAQNMPGHAVQGCSPLELGFDIG